MDDFVVQDTEEIKELRAQAANIYQEANELLKKEDRTAKDADEFESKMARLNEIQVTIDQKKALLSMDARMQASAGNQPTQNQGQGAKAEPPPGLQLKAPYDLPDGKGGMIKKGEVLPPFSSLAQMLYSVYKLSQSKGMVVPDPRLVPYEGDGEKKDLTDASGASGGFLIPVEYRNTLMSVAAERSIVRPRATVIRMTRRQLPIPVLNQTEAPPSGSSAFFGGIVTRWLEADAPKQETQPTFRQVQLVAKELSAYTEVSNTLMDDAAVPLEDFLRSNLGFAGAMAHAEDTAFINGDGNGRPIGYLKSNACISVTRDTASQVNYIDIVTMMSRALMGGNYVWAAHQTLIPQIFTLTDAAGNNIWLPHVAGVKGQAPGTLMGYPILFTEKVPALGSAGDFSLADFSYYLIGDRQQVTIDTSEHYLFQTNQMAWRVIERVDGKPWMSAPIPLADGNTTVSPFVKLGAS